MWLSFWIPPADFSCGILVRMSACQKRPPRVTKRIFIPILYFMPMRRRNAAPVFISPGLCQLWYLVLETPEFDPGLCDHSSEERRSLDLFQGFFSRFLKGIIPLEESIFKPFSDSMQCIHPSIRWSTVCTARIPFFCHQFCPCTARYYDTLDCTALDGICHIYRGSPGFLTWGHNRWSVCW